MKYIINILLILAHVGVSMASPQPEQKIAINSGVMLSTDHSSYIGQLKKCLDIPNNPHTPIVTIGDINNIIASMYEYNGVSYESKEIFPIINWTQGMVEGHNISANNARLNMRHMELFPYFQILRLNNSPYLSTHDNKKVRFSFIFFPQIIERVGPTSGYLFHLERERLENEEIINKSFNINDSEIKGKIRTYKEKYVNYPLPMISLAEVDFMNSLQQNSAYFSEILAKQETIGKYKFCAQNMQEFYLYHYTQFIKKFNNETTDQELIDYANKLSGVLNAPNNQNLISTINRVKILKGLGEFFYSIEDIDKAIYYYHKASMLGDSHAMTDLGYLLLASRNNINQGIEYFALASKLGSSKAMLELSHIYNSILKDYNKAAKYLESAIEASNPDAFIIKASLVADGQEPYKRDPKESRRLLKTAISMGDIEAIFELGKLYEHKLHVRNWRKKALKMYERASAAGVKKALTAAGLIHEKSGNIIFASGYYKTAADQGDIDAMVKFAKIHIYHHNRQPGFVRDLVLAVKLLHKAMRFNNAEAYLILGDLYQKGYIFQRDIPYSYYCLQKAASLGSSEAMRLLALCDYEGLRNPNNEYIDTISLLEKAADLGNSNAMTDLGKMYMDGDGVDINYTKALEYFTKAIKLNNPRALRNMATLYFYGHGVEQNMNKALKLTLKAADMNDITAIKYLAYLYEDGKYVTKNMEKSLSYTKRAATLGDLDSIHYLIERYLGQEITTENISKTMDLLKSAASLGCAKAIHMLGGFYHY